MPLFSHLFFFYTLDTFNHHSFIHKHSLRPISISSQLQAQWTEPPWGAEPSRAEPIQACLTASQRTSNWATLHRIYAWFWYYWVPVGMKGKGLNILYLESPGRMSSWPSSHCSLIGSHVVVSRDRSRFRANSISWSSRSWPSRRLIS